MPLPLKPKRDPRPVAVTVRLSEKGAKFLKVLAAEHNLSQADVIEHLLLQEYMSSQKKPKKEPKSEQLDSA